MKVERGEPDVLGPDPAASGLLLIDVPLTPTPDRAWASIFGGSSFFDAPPGVSLSVSMHPPRLMGAKVQLRAPDAEVEKYMQHLDERIAAANAEYAQSVAPEVERRKKAAAAEAERTRKRIEDARRRLKGSDDRAAE
jgi:hypothetical protein